MVHVWNLLHHIAANLFYFCTMVCIFLAIITTVGLICLVVGRRRDISARLGRLLEH